MIKDTIEYAGEIILTIYHKGFNNEISNRNIIRKENVGEDNLIFSEMSIEDRDDPYSSSCII